MEELADLILSADVGTVEAVQRRYGEQVEFIYSNLFFSNFLLIISRFLIVYLQHLSIFV